MELPPDLLDGIEGEREQAAILARFDVLKALRLGISEEMMRRVARLELTETDKEGNTQPLSFHRAIGKAVVGIHGNLRGLSFADVELEAQMQGTDELIYGVLDEEAEDYDPLSAYR